MNWNVSLESVRLSPRLFFFIGSGILYADSHYSSPITYTAGRDSWLAILLGGAVAIVLVGWVGTCVIRSLPDGTTLPQSAMPGAAAWRGIHLVTAVWAWCVAAWSLHRFTEFIQNEMMPLTPLEVFLFSLLLVTVWAGFYGPEACGRIITICALIIFPLPLVYDLLLSGHVHPHWLLPIAQESTFWHGCAIALSFFLQAAPLCVLFQFVEDRRKALRSMLLGLALCTVFAALARAVVVGVLSPYLAPYYAAPDYAAIRLIRLTESINRVELPLVWLWSYSSWAKTLLYVLLGTFALVTALGLKRWGGAHLVSAGLFVVTTCIGMLRPDGFGTINWLEMRYLYFINLGFQLLFLMTVTGTALLRRSRRHPARSQ